MVAEGRIAAMRRKFAASRLRKFAASRLRKYVACVRIAVMRRKFDAARLSNDKPAKRLKTSQRRSSVMSGRQASEASQDKPGHAARQDIHRLNTPSEDERRRHIWMTSTERCLAQTIRRSWRFTMLSVAETDERARFLEPDLERCRVVREPRAT